MSIENELHNKKNLFSIELFLESLSLSHTHAHARARTHTHTNIRTDSLIKL